jgi:hypothetical protein
MAGPPRVASITIPDTLTTPAAGYALGELTLVGVRLPSTFDGTTLTFTCSDTLGGTYDPLISDDGTTYTVTCAASKYVAIDYTKFVGVLFVKPVAGAQTGPSILTFYVAGLT